MEAIPYKLRLRLSDEIPQEGQCRVMARIPAFDVPEIDNSFSAPAGGGKTLLGMVLNMELGRFPAETAAFLRECPQARDADILFGNELDDGCCRSGCRNASAEIAEAIGMNYAFALEFIGLTDPEDPKGYGGNTLFSRWPIKRASVLHLPQGYNWYFDAQKRIGERVAILAVLDVAGREVGAVCAHLENKTHAAARALQMRVLLDEVDRLLPGMPVFMGGDFNTNTYDGADLEAAGFYLREQQLGMPPRDVAASEPLLQMAEAAGFSYRDCNDLDTMTRRKPLPAGVLRMHLDWIFLRGMTCLDRGTVSTEVKDWDWMAEDSPLRRFGRAELTDHNAVWALCVPL